MNHSFFRLVAGIAGCLLSLGLATVGAETIHIHQSYNGPWKWNELTMTTTTQGSGMHQTTTYKGTAEITGYTGSATDLVIPKKISWTWDVTASDGSLSDHFSYEVEVVGIGWDAFFERPSLTSVTIPDSVTSIGDFAFGHCSGLTSVTIGSGVTSIGERAFYNCSGLTSVTIPDSVTSIGDEVFDGCSGLTSVTILGNVTNDWMYNYRPFYGCTNIETVVLGGKMTKIGDYMFYNCPKVQALVIPDGVTSIGACAFSGCSGLTTVTIPNGVTNIGNEVFSGCSGLTSVTIPDSVTNIGYRAFYECSGLTSVTIPNGVTNIGGSAFSGGTSLTHVTIGSGVTSIGERAFNDCHSMEAFSVASDNPAFQSVNGLLLTKDGKTLLYGVNGDVTIPEGVTELTPYAFLNCAELTSVAIPGSVVRLPTTAFDGCSKLWTAWYRTLANVSASGGASGGGSSGTAGQTVSLVVTNVVVHYVTQSVPSGAVTPGTNSTGIVNVITEVTAPKAIAISPEWAAQYPGFEAKYGADFAAALTMENGKRDGAGNAMAVWQDYVAGTDPTDPASVFTASLVFNAETGEPVIGWSPELSPEETDKRLYTVSGKERMTDEEWVPVGDEAARFNFFRVTVEMR